MLVAVIVNDPAVAEENTTEVVVAFVNVPPLFVQLTPAPPTSFVTVAVSCTVCDVVKPPRFGATDTVIAAVALPRSAQRISSRLVNETENRTTPALFHDRTDDASSRAE